MSKVKPCLWFKDDAEEAVNFYVSVVPNSRIARVQRNLADGPSGKVGTVLVIDFNLGGQRFLALNGGMKFDYTHAVSFHIDCAEQAEVDHLWEKLGEGGAFEQCGWLKDRFGLSWQVVPSALGELLGDPDRDRAARALQAMLKMRKLDVAALRAAADGD